jgi:hypothetical protein
MREVVLEKTEAIKRREGGTKRESKKSFIQHLHFAAQELQTGKSFSNPPPCILIPLFLLQARMNSSRTFANKKKKEEKRDWVGCGPHGVFGKTHPYVLTIIFMPLLF